MQKPNRTMLIYTALIIFSLSCFPSYSYAKGTAKRLYKNARQDYYTLKSSKKKQSNISNWHKVTKKFLTIYRKFPKSSLADDALFTAGFLYYGSYKKFNKKEDLKLAIKHYKIVTGNYPKSRLADDALFRLGDIFFYDLKKYANAHRAYSNIIKNFSTGDMARSATKRLKAISRLYKAAVPKEKKHTSAKIIVIDPGHGGKDDGAKGKKNLLEKNVVLDISLRLQKIIKKQRGYKVILTRNKDIFIPLQERTAIANTKKADIFVSIHSNAAIRKGASGIETYYLDFAKSDRALETASRENKAPLAKVSDDVQYILADMTANSKMNESSQLASIIQKSLITGMRKRYKGVKDLQIKGGPFYVLHGANMPSILVETSFLTNPTERKRLGSIKYRERLAYYIFKGIEKYFKEIRVSSKTK